MEKDKKLATETEFDKLIAEKVASLFCEAKTQEDIDKLKSLGADINFPGVSYCFDEDPYEPYYRNCLPLEACLWNRDIKGAQLLLDNGAYVSLCFKNGAPWDEDFHILEDLCLSEYWLEIYNHMQDEDKSIVLEQLKIRKIIKSMRKDGVKTREEQREIEAKKMKKRQKLEAQRDKVREEKQVIEKQRQEIARATKDIKVSGVVVADEIAEKVIAGKETRVVTPDVGREYMLKRKEKDSR